MCVLLLERLSGGREHHRLNVRIPKNVLTCVTGVAGSGKSSLVAELVDTLRRRPAGDGRGGEVVVVDQRTVGRSSRSNPATYVGVFDAIRRAFAAANAAHHATSHTGRHLKDRLAEPPGRTTAAIPPARSSSTQTSPTGL